LKGIEHFVSKHFAVLWRIDLKQGFVRAQHIVLYRFSNFQPGIRGSRQLSHSVQLGLELAETFRSKFVILFASRSVVLLRALDPTTFKKSSNRSEEGTGAQPHTTVAETFDVFDERISMTGLICEAHQDQKYRLS
jgi:hypothetical protein